MTINEALRLIAESFVLLSLAPGYWVHPGWYLFHRVCGIEPFTVRSYEVVPDDVAAA